jgi:hypothetical protein
MGRHADDEDDTPPVRAVNERGRSADSNPSGTATSIQITAPPSTRPAVAGATDVTTVRTSWPLAVDWPRLPCRRFHRNWPYSWTRLRCWSTSTGDGGASPSRRRPRPGSTCGSTKKMTNVTVERPRNITPAHTTRFSA